MTYAAIASSALIILILLMSSCVSVPTAELEAMGLATPISSVSPTVTVTPMATARPTPTPGKLPTAGRVLVTPTPLPCQVRVFIRGVERLIPKPAGFCEP